MVVVVGGQSWEFWGFFGMTTQAPAYREPPIHGSQLDYMSWRKSHAIHGNQPCWVVPRKGERTSWNMWAIFPALFCFSREYDKPAEAKLLSEVHLFMDPIVSPFPMCHRASKRKFSPAQKRCLISVDTGRVCSSSSGKLEFNGERLSERNWDIVLCFSCCKMLHDFQLLNYRAIHSPNICWVIGWCVSLVFFSRKQNSRGCHYESQSPHPRA